MQIFLLLTVVSVALALPPVSPINCIKGCKCKDILPNILSVVDCEGVLTINSTIFSRLDRRIITVMSFSNVIIDHITEDAFRRLPNLEDVIIKKAQIGSIDSKAFNNIKKVKFADCGFEDSPNITSEKLEEVHFGSCKLDVIPPLDNLFSLTFLNLSGNYIKNIDIMSFTELFDLESLILSNNEITRLPANVFTNNEELSSLYLDNNPLKAFYLNTTNKLETLSLKNCYLSTFDERSSERLTSVSDLNLSNNKITNLSAKDLAHMNQLTVVDLSYNSLRNLDNDIFSANPKLLKVTLDGNKLQNLPNFTLAHDEKFQIYHFSCKDCGLTTLHRNTFKNMPVIMSLNLAYNHFTSIENMFADIKSLRMLDISYNKISSLSQAFENNRNLETLNIAGNSFTALNPNDFSNNKAIEKIDASRCKLKKLWSTNGTVLYSLRKLLLSENELTTLSIADFKIIPGLHDIDLHGNALEFDDKVCLVINYLESLSIYPTIYTKGTEGPLSDDIDNFSSHGWYELHKGKCPAYNSNNVHEFDDQGEYLEDDKDESFDAFKKLNVENDDKEDDNEEDDEEYDESYDSYNDYDKYEENNDHPEVVERENINLARVSYILSITSVFVLTALAVLIMAVVITLCILKRNNNFNMQKANLPRFKIPLWENQLTQKKHSGSVYRPLSEDLSGPKTPTMSRYEFAEAPTVHLSDKS
ncbi:leucine-rich repeat-containing protein 15-like [Anthonomus grandis grandis]|uniref:leucine-rich repeat-containing protein 15-like n=1 Tax=Anthonomus grandis grandis TaxID=2921223 RepID=UPI0021650F1A|nr:leucine-rich repeat-containing protein 15-like [Anthonomus grandis grandis]